MVAGASCLCRIWRMSNADTDDEVGGAIVTGSLVYDRVPLRFQAEPEEQLLMQQGLQTVRTFTGIIVPGTLDIRERDNLEITEPLDHVYYGNKFRIVSVRHSSHNRRDPRNYMMLGMIRNVRAHGEVQ